MALYNFDEFVNESYLKGGRQPLYHGTRRFDEVLESDTLKTHPAAYDKNRRDSISFTRSKFYTDYGGIRFMLDADLLLEDNYHPEPVDEAGMAIVGTGKENSPKYIGYAKSNIAMKINQHKLNIPPVTPAVPLNQEYEERLYKNVTNLGKYIIEIILSDENDLQRYKSIIDKYLEKYPHILITNKKGNILYSIKDIQPELGVKDVVNGTASLVDVNAE